MANSLSVSCRSAQSRDALVAFLRKHLRPFSQVAFEHGYDLDPDCDPTKWIAVGKEVIYGKGMSKVGFNFVDSSEYRVYMYAVMSWVAIHFGRRRGLNALSPLGKADEPVPYVTYNSTPLPRLPPEILASWPPATQAYALSWAVDSFGLSLQGAFTSGWQRNVVQQEMERLHTLWLKEGSKTN